MSSFVNRLRLLWVLMAVVLAGAAVYLFLQPTKPPVVQTEDESPRALASEGYAGAESCRECHQAVYATWSKTAHAHAMGVASPETVQGDFVRDTTHVYDGQSYRMFTRNERYFIDAPTRDGGTKPFEVLYVLGARQHENYLTRFPDGRLQILPVYYDLSQKRWYDAAEGTLELGQAMDSGQYYFWANHGRTWNKRCFDCHASQIRKRYDLKTNTYDTVVGDLSINCESCHGPGAKHIAFWQEAGTNPNLAMQEDLSMPDLSRLSAKQQVEICAQCHALKSVLRSGYVPGADYQDFYEPFLIDTSEFYWPDGLAKKLAYPYLQFANSACFLKAGLTCTGCHANHGSDRTAELVADPGGVGLCARCHPSIAADVNGHTHHLPTGPGGDCNQCHMPQQFRNELIMTDHRITVPVPENTVKLGIPNACNQSGCHADKSADWASDWATTWYGNYQQTRVAKAEVIDRGRKGDASVAPVLANLLTQQDQAPLFRAGVASIVGKLGDTRAISQLTVALADSHSAIRAQAAAALGRLGHPAAFLPLARALSDSVFSVRIRAVYALASLEFVPQNGEQKQLYDQALAEFRSVVGDSGLMADDGNMHMNMGQLYEFSHQYDRALEHYRYALRFTPGLAELQTRMQHLLESEARYQKLVEMVTPMLQSDVRAQVALGLAYVHRGKPLEGIALLTQAQNAGVRSELIETGLGDAYRYLGQFDEAATHYWAALKISSAFPGAHRGLAFLSYMKGDSAIGRRHLGQVANGQSNAATRVRDFMKVP